MTPEQVEVVKESIAANRRMAQTLDRRIAQLKALAVLENDSSRPAGNLGDEIGQDPYFYGVLGRDGLPGVVIGDQSTTAAQATPNPLHGSEDRRIWTGVIQLQNDAPFVWTHMAVTGTFFVPTATAGVAANPAYRPFITTSGKELMKPQNFRFPRLDIGLIEVGSGRVLFQADRFDPPDTRGELIPTTLFDVMRHFRPNAIVSPIADVIESSAGAPGHGPSTMFELPAEVELPKNGVVEVQARAQQAFNAFTSSGPTLYIPRLYVTLIGYKVYGD